jgi:hypothetical protein
MNRGSGRGSSNGYSGNRGRGNYQNGRGGGGKCMNIHSIFFRRHVQDVYCVTFQMLHKYYSVSYGTFP